jgi:hypothetical protein
MQKSGTLHYSSGQKYCNTPFLPDAPNVIVLTSSVQQQSLNPHWNPLKEIFLKFENKSLKYITASSFNDFRQFY